MSVLVYTESWEGKFKKSTFEVVSYAKKVADNLSADLCAIACGNISDEEAKLLGKYGATKVLLSDEINKGDNQSLSTLIASNSSNYDVIVFSNTNTGKMIAPRVAVKLRSALVSNAVEIPTSSFSVKKKVFSGKAFENSELKTDKKIISISPNSYGIFEVGGNCVIEKITSPEKGNITIEGQETSSGKINLSEAEIIVSAGRGLKGGENWGMIEELADVLGAATACSKPVADIGWRPHSEHVGQTGKSVAPNLYIAIGISGAIQHLAGVNSSKLMVAINTDPEAPFFKAADYGIVGDAFEVVPKLIEEIKKLKN